MGSLRSAMIPAELSDLPFGEQLMLWAIRLWVQAYTKRVNVEPILRHGFKLAGAPTAQHALDDLMCVIATSAKTHVDIGCVKCTMLSDDEHRLLACIAASQQDDRGQETDRMLECWLPPAAVRCARGPVLALAKVLKERGLMLRRRSASVETGLPAITHTASQTVH